MNHNKSCSASPPPPSTHSTLSNSSSFTSILQECNCDLWSLGIGDYIKAAELAEAAISRHSGSTLLHHARSLIHYKIGLQIRDSATVRLKHLNKSLESSRQALALSPKAISFVPLHAILLFELAEGDNVSSGFEAVIQQCECALLIQNPTGPASSVEKSKKRLVEIIEKSHAKIILLEWRRFLEAKVTVEFKAMQQRDLVGNHAAEKKTL